MDCINALYCYVKSVVVDGGVVWSAWMHGSLKCRTKATEHWHFHAAVPITVPKIHPIVTIFLHNAPIA